MCIMTEKLAGLKYYGAAGDGSPRIIHESRPSVFGGLKHYDNKGHKVGESRPGIWCKSL